MKNQSSCWWLRERCLLRDLRSTSLLDYIVMSFSKGECLFSLNFSGSIQFASILVQYPHSWWLRNGEFRFPIYRFCYLISCISNSWHQSLCSELETLMSFWLYIIWTKKWTLLGVQNGCFRKHKNTLRLAVGKVLVTWLLAKNLNL